MATVTMETEGKGLERNLAKCGINAEYVRGVQSPQMFRFEFETHSQTTISAIKKAVEKLRIAFGGYFYDETPTGKGFAITRPFDKPDTVWLGNLSEEILKSRNADANGAQKAYICFGKDINNNSIITNMHKCKSILIAGTAGSGKSVLLNSLIMQLLCYSNARLLLIDPKDGAEFGIYENDVHNRIDRIAKNTPDAIQTLKYAFDIMQSRFAKMGNDYMKTYDGERVICVIDELAELMAENKDEVTPLIERIAAKGRAAGVHLIIATQVPYISILGGKVKYNMQTKVCLKTANQQHSKNVIDVGKGAELLGYGDAYIKFEDNPNLIRAQTPYISDDNIWELITKRTV